MGSLNPIAPQQMSAYRQWRSERLDRPPPAADMLRVHIDDPDDLQVSEIAALKTACHRYNFALFHIQQLKGPPEDTLKRLGEQLGLRRLDHNLCAKDSGISALSARPEAEGERYVPYTDRRLSWHTDGYYNPPDRQIRSWILYCAQDAVSGGENALLDHEIAYIRLRDHDPALAEALTAPDVLTIPANVVGGNRIRAAHSGPVFSWMPDNGRLHMRYSARERNVIWQDRAAVLAAADWLRRLLYGGDDHISRYRLNPGEGLLSNNVLHFRSGFRDDPATGHRRLVYRARYYDRIADT